jgi:ATP-dependent Clp endopeptidase proteolytic subunit ClpP
MKTNLESWFEHSVDEASRTIYLGSTGSNDGEGESGVDHLMAERLIKGLSFLEKRSTKPIHILMNNPGGDWYHGMAIYDAIHLSSCHCTIAVYGYAMSMGSVILQAADSRVMMPNSRLMIHYGTDGAYGHSKTFEKLAQEARRINTEMENIYLDAIMEKDEKMEFGYLEETFSAIFSNQGESISPKLKKVRLSQDPEKRRDGVRNLLRELLNFDTFLTAEETVALGLADSVQGLK